mgnify:CR=1 FL=1
MGSLENNSSFPPEISLGDKVQDIESKSLSKLDELDRNIQKITKKWTYCLFGIGRSDVKGFREKSFEIANNLSESSNRKTLVKIK